jgi:hypothetical protein
MNDTFRDLKARMRALDGLLGNRGPTNVDFAQALSMLHRAARKGDRSREPTGELRALLEHAEDLARSVVA